MFKIKILFYTNDVTDVFKKKKKNSQRFIVNFKMHFFLKYENYLLNVLKIDHKLQRNLKKKKKKK